MFIYWPIYNTCLSTVIGYVIMPFIVNEYSLCYILELSADGVMTSDYGHNNLKKNRLKPFK